MSPCKWLKKRPPAFKNLTGIGVAEFDQLYHELLPRWNAGERQRLSRPNRKRAFGGGHPYRLELEDQLLMTLLWLHLQLNTAALSALFGLDKANVSRNIRRVWQILPHLNLPLEWPEPPKRGHGRSLQQAGLEYPDLSALADSSDQANRSSTNPNPQDPRTLGKQIKCRLIYELSGG